ncbi:menaquinone reductase molybdopterin-binding-like subunit QrcB [Desulfovibrio ferrophilus]|uniref:Anaerobic dehydrogenase, typically selenocysteine-containing n=1 Tax=Desulfovibrio ferrophilus TaxID=241368 RepID=A0A2Z6AZW0_9BACT|nr:menaquinone reductase molybdopterin-binding-like subunit QrcB [Desulfovibrio ferrophilus]BBD08725.1 anaerobic dehydrogenase, typically selenocysteine-containing [Desulfovibrio ferrophilus]
MNRRTFLTFSAGATAGLMITPIPWKLTDDASIWTQNWQWNPKVPKRAIYFAEMASKLDPSGSGVKVAVVNGNAVGVAGNVDHPLGKGAVSTMAAAEVGLLHSPARVRQPMLKTATGFKAISWDEAETILTGKLSEARGEVAMVSGDDTGSANEIFAALVNGLDGSFYMMPGETQSAHKALEMMGGEGRIAYDIENADYVLFLGADALESSGTSTRNARVFSETHPTGKAASAKYVYAGPVMNNTAVVCDQWIQAKPGAAATVALGLSRILMDNGAVANAKGFASFKQNVAQGYAPAHVERETGVRADVLKKIARELAAAKRPLVIAGSEFGQGAGARALMASLGLNVLLGQMGQSVKIIPGAPAVVQGAGSESERYAADVIPFLKGVAEGRDGAKVLMVYDANPAYGLPQTQAMAKAMDKAAYTVSFSSFMDETAERANLIMPNSMTAERYDDLYTPHGAGTATYSVNKPLVKSAFDTRTTADVMLSVASRLGMDLGYASFKDVLQAKATRLGASWSSLRQGKAWTSASASSAQLNLAPCAAPAVRAIGEGTLALAPVVKHNIGTSKVAMPPHSAGSIRDTELSGVQTVVQMNAKTARMSGVKAGETVKLMGPGGEMTAQVYVSEKVMTGVVAAPLGFGHTAWDGFSKGVGENAFKLLAAADDPETGLSVWSTNRVTIATA